MDNLITEINECVIDEQPKDHNKIGYVKKRNIAVTTIGGVDHEIETTKEFDFWDADKQKYTIFSKTKFCKLYTPSKNNMHPTLTQTFTDNNKIDKIGLANTMILIDYTDEDNRIIITTKLGNVSASKVDIQILLDAGEDSTKKYLSKCKKLGIIKKAKNDYFINPLYVMRVRNISLDLYQLFKIELDPYLSEQAKKDIAKLIRHFSNNAEVPQDIMQPQDVIDKYVDVTNQVECRQKILEVYESNKNDEEYRVADIDSIYCDSNAIKLKLKQSNMTKIEYDKAACPAYGYIYNLTHKIYNASQNKNFIAYENLKISLNPQEFTPDLFIFLHVTLREAIENELPAKALSKKTYGLMDFEI